MCELDDLFVLNCDCYRQQQLVVPLQQKCEPEVSGSQLELHERNSTVEIYGSGLMLTVAELHKVYVVQALSSSTRVTSVADSRIEDHYLAVLGKNQGCGVSLSSSSPLSCLLLRHVYSVLASCARNPRDTWVLRSYHRARKRTVGASKIANIQVPYSLYSYSIRYLKYSSQ